MIVVDTNVLSELMRPKPAEKVVSWLRFEPMTAVFTTAITEGELLYGLQLLAPGRRRDALEIQIGDILAIDFEGRILPFDSAAATEYAQIAASRRSVGRRMSEPDARIAAIARSRRAAVATRNIGDFTHCGLEIINPWA